MSVMHTWWAVGRPSRLIRLYDFYR